MKVDKSIIVSNAVKSRRSKSDERTHALISSLVVVTTSSTTAIKKHIGCFSCAPS